jgi:hypothetical protein
MAALSCQIPFHVKGHSLSRDRPSTHASLLSNEDQASLPDKFSQLKE